MSAIDTVSIVDSFRTAIEAAGITPPADIISDGRLHRFASNGRRDDDAGWYVLHSDGIPAGAFGCWRSGVSESWCGRAEQTLTATEQAEHRARIEAVRRQRDIEERRQHAEAAKRASAIWESALPAHDHPYLIKKSVQSHGLRLDDDQLVIPMKDLTGALHSLQFIDADGEKRFLPGGRVTGCFHLIGDLKKVVCLTEGYATGATIYQATDYATIIAFSAGNLIAVARALRAKYRDVKLVVCGDNAKTGVGQARARDAADAVDGIVVIPEEEDSDWNDIAVKHGPDAVRHAIVAALGHGISILDEVHAFLGRFIAYPSAYAHVAHTLWLAHTHLMDVWESTPRLAFLSPEPSSGKTRALELSETLVPRPIEAINATPAYLFRKISDRNGLPTVLYDEIDTLFGPRAKEHEELRGVINAGHRRGAVAGRCVVKGKTIETEELPAFCAVAMAGLGNLPDTILSRSVIARMRRRAPTEVVEPYRRRVHAPEGYQLRDRLAVWTQQIRATLNTSPTMPDGITDRNADVWEPLFAVADAAGGTWPERARVSAVSLVSDAKGGQHSLGIRLLTDLRTVFGTHDAMWTVELLTALHALDESPWGYLKGKPLDARRLANLLQPYGVTPKQIRIGDKSQKGYSRESLWDAWSRYLPSEEPAIGSETTETRETASTDDGELFLEEDGGHAA